MKKTLQIAATILIAAGTVFAQDAPTTEQKQAMAGQFGVGAVNALKLKLNDQESLRVNKVFVSHALTQICSKSSKGKGKHSQTIAICSPDVPDTKLVQVLIEYRAKNQMGGYVTDTATYTARVGAAGQSLAALCLSRVTSTGSTLPSCESNLPGQAGAWLETGLTITFPSVGSFLTTNYTDATLAHEVFEGGYDVTDAVQKALKAARDEDK